MLRNNAFLSFVTARHASIFTFSCDTDSLILWFPASSMPWTFLKAWLICCGPPTESQTQHYVFYGKTDGIFVLKQTWSRFWKHLEKIFVDPKKSCVDSWLGTTAIARFNCKLADMFDYLRCLKQTWEGGTGKIQSLFFVLVNFVRWLFQSLLF